MLVGKRIKLRAVEESDISKMVRWRNSPDVYEFFYEYEPLSEEEKTELLDRFRPHTKQLAFYRGVL